MLKLAPPERSRGPGGKLCPTAYSEIAGIRVSRISGQDAWRKEILPKIFQEPDPFLPKEPTRRAPRSLRKGVEPENSLRGGFRQNGIVIHQRSDIVPGLDRLHPLLWNLTFTPQNLVARLFQEG